MAEKKEVETVKTLRDLNDMKNKKCIPFGNQYDYFFATLEDYYIAKLDGKERIKAELKKWDKEAQKFIVNNLAEMIENSGMINFDRNDVLLLTESF